MSRTFLFVLHSLRKYQEVCSLSLDVMMDLNLRETELTLGLPGEASRPIGGKFGSKREFFNSSSPNAPPAKAQVVGWPPVKEHRKNAMKHNFVKVAVDGAPYLRKVDLEVYSSYGQLLDALQNLFSCFSICHHLNERKLVDAVNGSEYVPTYEDKDGDWMLVGDVPWRMFVESCKRLRLMKSSDAMGLISY